MKKLKYGKDILYYIDEKNIKLYDKIKNTCYNIERIFKNDQRSYVALIEIDGEKYVLKRPIEKNRRKWQRFLSIFRGSESRREFENIQRINELDFNGAIPYLAVETKFGLCVVDSYLVYSYLEGEEGLFSGVCLSNELNSNPPYICSGHSIPNKSNADLITFIVTSTTFNLASFTFSSSTLIWQS